MTNMCLNDRLTELRFLFHVAPSRNDVEMIHLKMMFQLKLISDKIFLGPVAKKDKLWNFTNFKCPLKFCSCS